MNSFPLKKGFPINPRITTQEIHLKHILTRERIPFIFQKQFHFPDRWYIVDFFLADQLVLECSQTQAFKYEVALRHKAIYLEAKAAFLKRFFDYPIWVLFESYRTIGERFVQTLARLMPSVDRILTSSALLCENLQEYFRKKQILESSNCNQSLSFSSPSTYEPTFGSRRQNSPHNISSQNYCPYIVLESNLYKQLTQQPHIPPFTYSKRAPNNYSHTLNKNYFVRPEVFLP